MAERALRRTADYYFADGQFDLAADAYGAHAKAYPRNPNLPEILLRQAFANYAQFTGVRFDPTPLVDARAQMLELINRYPEVAERENIASFVDSIDKTLARKLWVTADFYRRTNKPVAQKQVLEVLVKEYPQTDEAQNARQMLGS
jgi:outer membrane assembly lipoprotein YfiO